jgi:hypothetical protein
MKNWESWEQAIITGTNTHRRAKWYPKKEDEEASRVEHTQHIKNNEAF